MKFAIFSGSAPDIAPDEIGRLAASQGWDGVEWWFHDQKPADSPTFFAGSRALFTLAGIGGTYDSVRAANAPFRAGFPGLFSSASISDVATLKSVAAAAAALGAGRVRIGVPKTAPGTHYDDLFRQTQAEAREAAKIFAGHGVQGLIQIHHGNIVSTPSSARRLLDGIDPAHIGIIHDLGNMSVEGREGLNTYTPGMEILGPYFAHAHVKNIVWQPSAPEADGTVNWSWRWAPLATGFGDVKGYFRSLAETGYDGWVTIENFIDGVPTEARLAGDLAYIRAAAREAGCKV